MFFAEKHEIILAPRSETWQGFPKRASRIAKLCYGEHMPANFQKKKSIARLLESWPALLALLAAVIFFAWGVLRFAGRMLETTQNRKMAEAKVAELEKSERKLTGQIESLKTEQGVEASIREKFGLAKEGEGLVVIVEAPESAPPPAQPGFWDFIVRWFK